MEYSDQDDARTLLLAHLDAVTERIIEPYGLVDHRGHWYVVAHDRRRERIVSFRVDRIREAVLLVDEEYEVPDDFTAESYRRDEIYQPGPEDVAVKVRFAPGAAARTAASAITPMSWVMSITAMPSSSCSLRMRSRICA